MILRSRAHLIKRWSLCKKTTQMRNTTFKRKKSIWRIIAKPQASWIQQHLEGITEENSQSSYFPPLTCLILLKISGNRVWWIFQSNLTLMIKGEVRKGIGQLFIPYAKTPNSMVLDCLEKTCIPLKRWKSMEMIILTDESKAKTKILL